MSCERFVEEIADVAAGAPSSLEVESHLATCVSCRAELDARRRALALAEAELRELLSAEPSPVLSARIRRAVDVAAAARGASPGWLWPAAAVAVTVLVALAVVALRDEGSRRTPQVASDASAGPRSRPDGPPVEAPASPAQAGSAPAVRARGAASGRPRPAPAGASVRLIEAEVLVPAGQLESLVRFAEDLQRRRVEPGSLLVADVTAPLPEPHDIEIPPLDIAAVDSDTSDRSGPSGL